jgi:hypothetical protein
MSLSFLFDEGMPQKLAHALEILDKGVEHVLDSHAPGTPDVALLEYAGRQSKVFLSRNVNMLKVPAERESISRHRVGVFFLDCRKLRFWEIVEFVIRQWRTIEECAETHRPPYAFLVRKRGRKFKRVGP